MEGTSMTPVKVQSVSVCIGTYAMDLLHSFNSLRLHAVTVSYNSVVLY